MTRQQYWEGFEHYVRGQGFINIFLEAYSNEINNAFYEEKNYEQLFTELFN